MTEAEYKMVENNINEIDEIALTLLEIQKKIEEIVKLWNSQN